jgi:hypothetical protein
MATVMTHSLSVTPERVVKWMLAVPGATVHAVPYGSIEMTYGDNGKAYLLQQLQGIDRSPYRHLTVQVS